MVKNNEVKLFSFSFDKCTVTASSSKMAIIERILKRVWHCFLFTAAVSEKFEIN